MRRSRRTGIVAAEAMVTRERGAQRVDGDEVEAMRLRISGQQARKSIGGVRRRKAVARETGGDNIGRRVDTIFQAPFYRVALGYNQIHEPRSLSIPHSK
jgi:hypothetical protein